MISRDGRRSCFFHCRCKARATWPPGQIPGQKQPTLPSACSGARRKLGLSNVGRGDAALAYPEKLPRLRPPARKDLSNRLCTSPVAPAASPKLLERSATSASHVPSTSNQLRAQLLLHPARVRVSLADLYAASAIARRIQRVLRRACRALAAGMEAPTVPIRVRRCQKRLGLLDFRRAIENSYPQNQAKSTCDRGQFSTISEPADVPSRTNQRAIADAWPCYRERNRVLSPTARLSRLVGVARVAAACSPA